MSKVNLVNGPYTIKTTVPENEYYKYEWNCEPIGQSTSDRTSGLWNVRNDELNSTQYFEDYIRIESKFLYDYVTTKNQYNLKVVKELLEGMLQEVNNTISWISEIEDKLKNDQ